MGYVGHSLLENFCRISLYVTDDDTVFCTALCDVKFSKIEGNGGRNFSHI